MIAAGEVAVHLDLADTAMRLALTYVVEQAGFARARDSDDADIVVVDRAEPPADRPVVLLVDPAPASCRTAVQRVSDNRAVAVVCADEPDRLPDAILAAMSGWAVMPQRVVRIASGAPVLGGRLAETLRFVVAGRTNADIARALHESESTAKRDVGVLLRTFGASTRGELAATARALGYDARRRLAVSASGSDEGDRGAVSRMFPLAEPEQISL